MARLIAVAVLVLVLTGCAARRVSRDGVLSQELPITLSDIAEIKTGEENHQKVLEQYYLYDHPKLQTYVNEITASIAAVSTRPHLPYHVFLLDDGDVNIFGGPGGYIYVTRGLLNFVESEAELAGVIAHEIGHISHNDYSNIPQHEKAKKIYGWMMKGSEFAKGSIGTYGTAANYGLKGIGKAAPIIAKRFGSDAEIVADEKAAEYLLAAGYDPREYQKFVERLSRVEIQDVSRFVILLNTHPPFPDRRTMLNTRLAGKDYTAGEIEFKKDMLSEVRQMVVNAPTSVLFTPQLGVHNTSPLEVHQVQQTSDEKEKSFFVRKRWGWF